jgi:putative serine protease PepD
MMVAGLGLPVALAGCTGGGSAAASGTPSGGSPTADLTAVQQAYQQVIGRVLPSVVEIRTPVGLGSGVVFDDKGDVVTNDHVVGDATSFQVIFSGSATSHDATLVGSYPPDDLAVIRVADPGSAHPATFAASSTVQVGTIVLAMGNPLVLASSVTDGIVSAVGRTVSEPQGGDSPGATLPDAIQTSAAINPGNSGGALVDLRGRVVGIPTLAATDPQLGGGAAPGIGFAIPADIVTDIAGQLVKSGTVTDSHRAALGVRATTVTGPSGDPTGVGVVSVVAGGPADAAGISAGDVLIAVNGQKVDDTQQLAGVLGNLSVGKTVPVTVRRAGGTTTVQVTLGELPGG